MCNEQSSGDLKYNPITLMKLQRRESSQIMLIVFYHERCPC